jgi:integral membrane protein (TIGR01906 family)
MLARMLAARVTGATGVRAVLRTVELLVVTVALGTMLLLTNVRLAATWPAVYEYSFGRYAAVERTGVSRPELDRAAREIVEYFGSGHRPDLAVVVTVDGRNEPLFNQREVLHMGDVRELFRRAFRIQQLVFLFIALHVAGVILRHRAAAGERLARLAVVAGAGTALALAVAALAVLVAFRWLFTQFHLISFTNDFWMLDPRTDRLIQMFPAGFWFDVTIAVGVATLLQAALLALLGLTVLRLHSER